MSQQFFKHPSAVKTFTVDFTKQLAVLASPAENLVGQTPVGPTQINPPDNALTIGSGVVNVAIVVPPNKEPSVPIGQGVSFACSGGTDGKSYEGRVSCLTTSSPNEVAIDFIVTVGNQY